MTQPRMPRTRGPRRAAVLAVGTLLLGGVLPSSLTTPAFAASTKTFSTHGKYTFTVPAGVTKITATVTAAGGGGAGSSAAGVTKQAGGGGGGGATSKCTLTVRPGQRVRIGIGRGGYGGALGAAGKDGSPTFIDIPGVTSVHASPGRGGGQRTVPTLSQGGEGGTACGAVQEGHRGGDASFGASSTPGAGGAAATPAATCPAETGNGGNGGAIGASGSPGHNGCAVITY